MSTASPSDCFECGTALSAEDTSGLCTKCLIRMGLVSQLSKTSFGALASGIKSDVAVREPFNFGVYRILSLLGRGGMGAVYEAEQLSTGRRVALKVLGTTLDTPEAHARFIREGQLAATVRHPNVVAVFAAEEVEGAPVIAMEIVPDGTLKERVVRDGPMPITQAVETVLQIIDGLEAAHAKGVLHRDIKPANCFLSPDGTVKMGDFGLSISLSAKPEEREDETGQVVGTPAFASPEQLRGEEVGVRSDIYSVGSTFYYLLTGKRTHERETLEEVIAAVLDEDPKEPLKVRSDIPRKLSRVVMRCLARNPGARYESYAALRAALLPFRAGAPVPAPLGLRFVAGLLDLLVMVIPSLAFRWNPGEAWMLIDRTPATVLIYLAFVAWEILCVCVPEGIWGAGPGKLVCGLRVIGRDGGAPGLPRAIFRGAILALAEHLGDAAILIFRTGAEYQEAVMRSRFLPEEMLGLLLLVLLFVPMRRRNGFAAVQDRVTGTRVVVAPTALERLPIPDVFESLLTTKMDRIGPFAIHSRKGEWVVAMDEALRRRVWIRMHSPGYPKVEPARRDVNRIGRLCWLMGRRSETENWDAYEAPDGAPLAGFLEEQQPWARVRTWLLDLAEEFREAQADGTLPQEVGFDRLWITREGRVLLLDFPAPGGRPAATRRVQDRFGVQEFLADVAAAVLPARLPLHAREFLETLRARGFESTPQVAASLRALADKPSEVNPQRRLLSVAMAPAVALGIMLAISLGRSRSAQRFDAMWAREHGQLPSLRLVLEVLREESVTNLQTAENCSLVLAGRYRGIIEGQAFWSRPETDPWRDRARGAIAAHHFVSDDSLRRAEEWIAPHLQKRREREAKFSGWLLGGAEASLNFLLLSALIGLTGTLIFGVPPGLWLNDMAIVTSNGAPALRGVAFFRGLLGWLPLLAGSLALALCQFVPWLSGAFPAVAAVCAVLTVWLLSFSVRRPSRGLNDVIAGTWLVPR